MTSTLTDPYNSDVHDTSDVYTNLEAANEAARHFGDDYGFGKDEECDVYEEEFTSDGRLTIHMEGGEENTFDVEVEARTEVAASDEVGTMVEQQGGPDGEQKPRHAEGVPESKTKPAKKEREYVYVLTHEEYLTEVGDCGPAETIGVYWSVASANTAASIKATEDHTTSDDEEEDSSNEFSNWVECHDKFGCINISQDDGENGSWKCTVERHEVKGLKMKNPYLRS